MAVTVAIDGPSGSGKSTVARELARRHRWRWVDTGAMYRALTWWVLRQGVAPDDAVRVADLAAQLPLELSTDPDAPAVLVADADVTAAIRAADVTAAVSAVSALGEVRRLMIERQRGLAAAGNVVMEGRDIGTTVLPDATLKIFLTADESERAARRSGETGGVTSDVAAAMARRDRLDSTRTVSPLQRAEDAVIIDSSRMSIEQVVAEVESELTRRSGPRLRSVAALPAARFAFDPYGNRPHPLLGEGWRLRWFRRAARLVFDAVLRVRVTGQERIPKGAVLLAGNHTGWLDGPLVWVVLGTSSTFLAKSELFSGFWAGTLRILHQLPVHRGAPDRNALHAALEALEHGGVVAMFPEGTRGEGKLETIQDGVGYIAAHAGCPVVPVVCKGTARALPRGKVLPRFRTGVDVVFGEPFSVSPTPPLTRADIRTSAEEIAQALRDMVAEVGLD